MDERKTILANRIFCEKIRRLLQNNFNIHAERGEMLDLDWVCDQFGNSDVQDSLRDLFDELSVLIHEALLSEYQPPESRTPTYMLTQGF
jgi:hypothetical protein